MSSGTDIREGNRTDEAPGLRTDEPCRLNSYARERLTIHLQRRSQRRYRPPEGKTYYQHLNELGLVVL